MPTPEEMAQRFYDLVVRNHTPLYGRWTGWRMAGTVLVDPSGTRFTPERLRGLHLSCLVGYDAAQGDTMPQDKPKYLDDQPKERSGVYTIVGISLILLIALPSS